MQHVGVARSALGRRFIVAFAVAGICALSPQTRAATDPGRDVPSLIALYAEALKQHGGLIVEASRTSRNEPPPGHHRYAPPERAKLMLLPPTHYKLEVMRGEKTIETVVSDGRTQWLWNSKFTTEAPAPRKLRFMAPNMEWAEKAYWPLMMFTSPALLEQLMDRKASNDTLEQGRKAHRISGRTHEGQTAMQMTVWLDAEDHLPRKLIADDGQVEVTMSFVVKAQTPSVAEFSLRPPAGLPRRRQDPEYPQVAVGKPAPAFTLKTLDGKSVSPSTFKGKSVLLDFWAPWCPTCMLSSPFLNRVQAAWADRGLQVLAISTMATSEEVAAYVQKHPQAALVLHDPADEEATVGYARYKITGFPSFVLLDPKGRVRRTWKHYWPGASEARLLAFVEEMLDEAAAPPDKRRR